jgi:hypothetical protein
VCSQQSAAFDDDPALTILHEDPMRNPFGKASLLAALVAAPLLAACDDDDDNGTGPETEFEATLTGAAERPDPVTTTATGTADVEINANNIEYTVNVSGLSAAATMAHIHGPATTGEAAQVVAPLTGLTTNTTGLLATGTITATAVSTISLDSLKAMIRNGRAYINVHTAANPAGEIRGQIVPK